MSGSYSTKKTVAIHISNHFALRDIMFSDLWEQMSQQRDIHFVLISKKLKVVEYVNSLNSNNISAKRIPPRSHGKKNGFSGRLKSILRSIDENHMFDSVLYRFGAVNKLGHYLARKDRSPEIQSLQKNFLDYRKGEGAAKVLPSSALLFKLMKNLRRNLLSPIDSEELDFFSSLNADLIFQYRIQDPESLSWSKAIANTGAKTVGVVGSWDHPTTKGPIFDLFDRYHVQSLRMKKELVEFHSIAPEKIFVSGKLQMDQFHQPDLINRDRLLEELGASRDKKLILLATNCEGLKEHEVSIARKLAEMVSSGEIPDSFLLIRTHPQDNSWSQDFLPLEVPGKVRVQQGFSFELKDVKDSREAEVDQLRLRSILAHSNVVVQSRGSILLDAFAFDTPVVSLAFDGDLPRSASDSFLTEYLFEHYRQIVESKCTFLVKSYESMKQSILDYFENPMLHKEGRKAVVKEHITFLDGLSAKRFISDVRSILKLENQSESAVLFDIETASSSFAIDDFETRSQYDLQGFLT